MKGLSVEEIGVLREYFETWWEELPGWTFLVNDRERVFPPIHIQVGKNG